LRNLIHDNISSSRGAQRRGDLPFIL